MSIAGSIQFMGESAIVKCATCGRKQNTESRNRCELIISRTKTLEELDRSEN